MRRRLAAALLLLSALLPGCTTTAEGNEAFGAFFITIVAAIAAAAALALNLVALGIHLGLRGKQGLRPWVPRLAFWIGTAVSALSIAGSAFLVFWNAVNYSRCPGGCGGILGETAVAFCVSLIPAFFGVLSWKLRQE